MAETGRDERRTPGAEQPRYVPGQKPFTFVARFPSGREVELSNGRDRAYPGLPGPAPSTTAFYAAARAACSGELVLDVGCGSAVGARRLADDFDAVVGIDSSRDALAFASEYFPDAHYEHSDLSESISGIAGTAAVVVDVLGHAKDPVAVLASVRQRLMSSATILVAEPRAYPAQRLIAPARRAYSDRRLGAVLIRGGFDVATLVAQDSSFSGCVAVPLRDDAWAALDMARRMRTRSSRDALVTLTQAPATSHAGLQREMSLVESELRAEGADYDGAVKALLRAAELDRSDPRAPALLSEMLLSAGARSDAIDLAMRAVDLDPTDPDAARALARCADASNSDDALDAWRVAARLAPDRVDLCARVAELEGGAGNGAAGILAFEKVRQYGDPLTADFSMALALMLSAEGRLADAKLEARIAKRLAPDDPVVLELCTELGAP